jgi:hypothetical protein
VREQPADVYAITSAERGITDQQSSRTRRYLISMSIRTACVIAAIFVPGWPRWVLIAGAVVLPYFAVVIANAGRETVRRNQVAPVPVAGYASLPPGPSPH